jgi:hypothetical protein
MKHPVLPMLEKYCETMRSSDDELENNHPDYIVSQYFSNMGNTGCFMIRYGSYKYTVFGKALTAFQQGYVAQLFNVDLDPDELHNIATQNPSIVLQMDTLLRKELASGSNLVSQTGDYQEIDRYVKTQQQELYKEYFLNKTFLDRQWQRLLKCFSNPPSFFEDSDREAPCLLANELEMKINTTRRLEPESKLRKLFESAYHGFDDNDWKKVQEWIAETP